jgi:hypothetical protein
MKSRLLVRLLLLSLTLLLGSCAALLGPRDVELPLWQLQESLNRKFPFNSRYLELFDIYVSNPRLALQPETNRIVTTIDASVAPPFLNKAWKGSFTLSGVLALDPARRAVVLADPRMEQFFLDGLDPAYSRQVTRIGALLAEQILRDVPLYTFSDQEFRYGGTTFLPSKITTRPGSLVVTFEPAK